MTVKVPVVTSIEPPSVGTRTRKRYVPSSATEEPARLATGKLTAYENVRCAVRSVSE